jgi:hypothetical protein
MIDWSLGLELVERLRVEERPDLLERAEVDRDLVVAIKVTPHWIG